VSRQTESLVAAAKSSLTAAKAVDLAVDRAHEEPLYALAMLGVAIVHELHALTLTVEASIEGERVRL
jgi:hypothetical protein